MGRQSLDRALDRAAPPEGPGARCRAVSWSHWQTVSTSRSPPRPVFRFRRLGGLLGEFGLHAPTDPLDLLVPRRPAAAPSQEVAPEGFETPGEGLAPDGGSRAEQRLPFPDRRDVGAGLAAVVALEGRQAGHEHALVARRAGGAHRPRSRRLARFASARPRRPSARPSTNASCASMICQVVGARAGRRGRSRRGRCRTRARGCRACPCRRSGTRPPRSDAADFGSCARSARSRCAARPRDRPRRDR